MILRRIGLHGKFMMSLLVAAALPFFIGLIFFETLGYRYMLEKRGSEHLVEASSLLAAVTQAANAEADKLRTWLASESRLVIYVAEMLLKAQQQGGDPEQQARMLDEVWVSLPESDPQVRAVLDNQAAESLRRYQRVHAAAVEIMVTDARGHLLAATSKTSDFNQADEGWWQRGAQLGPGEFWRDTIHYDDSSRTFTIDVVLPLHRGTELCGMIKMGVEVEKLVPHLIMRGIQTDSSWYFVLRSGHILISSDAEIGSQHEQVPFELLNEIRSKEHGWTVAVDQTGEERIIGYSACQAEYIEPNAYVVFSSRTSELFEPLWGNFIGLAMAGLSLLGLCLLVGFFIIQRRVLGPLGRIEGAVRSLSTHTRLRRDCPDDEAKLLEQQQEVEARLRDIQKIRSGDQMELLAREISTLVSRVLHYQSEFDKRDGSQPPDADEDKGPKG